jgi:muramidase (phage lysozyme)
MSTTRKIVNYENGKPNHSKNLISLKIDNNEITNQNTVANIFNNYFLSIAESLNSGNNKQTNTKEPNPISYLINSFHQPFPKMSWHNASTQEIEKIIKSLKSKNAGGYDKISTRILKLSTLYVISPLTCICNAILNTGTFPDRLKYAIIKQILKKGGD